MGKSQKEKGARGERLWAAECQKAGFTGVHRVGQQQYQTGAEVADVEGLDGVHVECKFVEKLNLRRAMEQSEHDAEGEGRGNVPVVAHKTSRKPWLVTMLGKDWLEFYKAWQRSRLEIDF